LCEKLSFKAICKPCVGRLLSENKKSRILDNKLKVYSFFGYSSIAPILHVKHHFWGHRVLNQIAKQTFGKFAERFSFKDKVAAIGIDDVPQSGYSHTAILAKALKSPSIIPVYRALRATNNVKYSGQSYDFRRKHPRDFSVSLKGFSHAILVDDVITSGLTLKEASECLKKEGVNVLFALTLADAKE
jgi:competence protein ComFC